MVVTSHKSHGWNARFWLVESKNTALWLVRTNRSHHHYLMIMVMIIIPVKGRQKNLLWCVGILLCPNHLQVTDKSRKKTRKWSGTQGIILSCVIKYRWIIITRMRPISNHLIKMEHNHAYNSNSFCTWIKVVFPCRASFWLSILNLFFSH